MNQCIISVIIPVYNEEKNLPPLAQRLHKTLSEFGQSFQIIFINDASTDNSKKVLEEIRDSQPHIILIDVFKNNGKAAALEQGFKIAQGKYLIVIDADLQYDPEDIPILIQEMEKGADVVSARRVERFDSGTTIQFSRVYNQILRLICGIHIHDYFSGFKCFRKSVLDYLDQKGNLIRFISLFAFREGFKVVEVPLKHHQRVYGASRYSFRGRVLLALSDILIVVSMFTLNQSRMYFFRVNSFLLLSFGVTVLFIDFLVVGVEAAFTNIPGIIGIVLAFLGIQFLFFKKIWDAFFIRYQEGIGHRARNVKSITRSKSTNL